MPAKLLQSLLQSRSFSWSWSGRGGGSKKQKHAKTTRNVEKDLWPYLVCKSWVRWTKAQEKRGGIGFPQTGKGGLWEWLSQNWKYVVLHFSVVKNSFAAISQVSCGRGWFSKLLEGKFGFRMFSGGHPLQIPGLVRISSNIKRENITCIPVQIRVHQQLDTVVDWRRVWSLQKRWRKPRPNKLWQSKHEKHRFMRCLHHSGSMPFQCPCMRTCHWPPSNIWGFAGRLLIVHRKLKTDPHVCLSDSFWFHNAKKIKK